MAKESMKAREVKRAKLANRYAHKREEIACMNNLLFFYYLFAID